jgi:signal transduction histidine kinase/CheY-like chemotaxis protein
VEGILALPGAILLVASQPITDSMGSSPALGTLVFGRLLSRVEMERLSRIVQHPMKIVPLADVEIDETRKAEIAAPDGEPAPIVEIRGQNRIDSIVPLRDIGGKVTTALVVTNERAIYQEGVNATRYLTAFLMVICVAGAVLLFILLSRLVLSPLSVLTRNVRGIGDRGGDVRLPSGRNDEIGEVANAVNGMLDALSASEAQRARLEERLEHAHKLEAIGTLAGGIAHDFNNILMAIIGFCDLIDDTAPEDPGHSDEIDEIRKAATRAASLTDQLLSFGRRQHLELRAVDLNALLSDTAVMLRALLGSHVTLELDLAPGDATVRGDIGQLQQVIINLAVNSRDAMPRGGLLRIGTRSTTVTEADAERLSIQGGAWVVCTVQDSGEGMSDEVRARIFEPFFTTKELGRGTGLGLSVVWGIIQQIEGTIVVTSAPGQGATFDIYLPTLPPQAAVEVAATGKAPRWRGKGAILVAEDDRAIRAFLVKALTRAGYSVLEAADGEEALRLARESTGANIRLLLTDVVMPRVGGAALADRMRGEFPSIRIQYMSGNPKLMDSDVPIPDGVSVLQKPFNKEQLLRSVQTILGD